MHKILVIDDEEKHLQATKEYLEYQGFQVLIEKSAEKVLHSINRIKPDILIVDILMNNIDGYQFVEELKLKKDCKEIPFIFVTAKGMTQDRIRGYKLGCSGYIPKPFDPDELVAIIQNILTRKEMYIREIKRTRKEFRSINVCIENQYNLLQLESLKLTLTEREVSILKSVMQGFKNKEIASNLNTSIRNVEKYMSRLLCKTNCRNRTELIKLFYSNQIFLRANDGDRTRE
uniref:TctD-like protein n=1 Tax=Chroomonas placoidea TaxID=173977 RepID=A0A222AI31_9CRYP|nr:TctD-like protein [Chroomonas placoidea]ASO76008.1 TctD-like protein [Chroomonas placoidea]